MKKYIAALLAVVMVLSLAACAEPAKPKDKGSTTVSPEITRTEQTKPGTTKTEPGSENNEPDEHSLPKAAYKLEYPEAIGFEDFDGKRKVWEDNKALDKFNLKLGQFSWEMASAMLSGREESGNLSPISLYMALAMASFGAKGETKEQMMALLKADNDEMLLEETMKLYRRLYLDNEIGKRKVANSLWIDDDLQGVKLHFREEYIEKAKKLYSELYEVSFDSPEAGKAIAAWIKKRTEGVLSPPPSQPDPEQVMSIVNTIYFYDQWQKEFAKELNVKEPFYAPGKEVEAEYMCKRTRGIDRGENYFRASLPLKNGSSMIFVLPDEGVDLKNLTESPTALREAFVGGAPQERFVDWSLPKFSLGSEYKLKETLKQLGVVTAFSERNADFSGIVDNARLWISDVIHEARVSIDEKGVEAAAYTRIDYCGATAIENPQPIDFKLNRPFLYGITTGAGTEEALLFVGTCYNPVP